MSETSTSTFDFNSLIKDSKETLLNPKSYFASMRTSGGMTEPIIKAMIYGVVAGIFVFLWSLFGLSAIRAGFLGGAIGIMALVWYVIAAVIGLFIGGVILLIISSICKGSSDFEANVRVVASVMVVMPVSALLGFTVGINSYLGMIITLLVNLYALYLLYHGLVESLKANPQTSRIVMYVLAVLMVLFMLMGMSARNRMNRYIKNTDLKELIQEENKN